MSNGKKPEDSFIVDARGGFNLFHWAVVVYSMPFYVFLHSRFGKRGLNTAGAIAWLGIVMYGMLLHSPQIIAFSNIYLVACVFRRITYCREEMSQYQGWAYAVSFLLFGYRNERVLRAIEAGLVIFAGSMIGDVDISNFVFFGGVAMFAKNMIDMAINNVEIENIGDGDKRMKMLAEWRNRR